MKDQVDSLKAKGIAAEYLSSTLEEKRRKEIVSRLTKEEELKLLYVTPECITNYPTWLRNLHNRDRISLIAIDEVF